MKAAVVLIFIATVVAVLAVTEKSCLTINGRVECSTVQNFNVDNPVIIELIANFMPVDQTKVSQNGYFSVYGCMQRSFHFGPGQFQLRVYHTCKAHQPRKVDIKIPDRYIGKEYNLTDTLHLNSYLPEEKPAMNFDPSILCESKES